MYLIAKGLKAIFVREITAGLLTHILAVVLADFVNPLAIIGHNPYLTLCAPQT